MNSENSVLPFGDVLNESSQGTFSNAVLTGDENSARLA
jgi:hypothetical protein